MGRLSVLGLFVAGPIFYLIPEDSQCSEDVALTLLMEELQYSISSLFKDLELLPVSAVELDAMVLHSPQPSPEKVKNFQKLKWRLQEKLAANTLEAESKRQEIRSLWSQLKADPTFCIAFEKFTTGCKPSTLKRLQNQLQLCKEEMHKRRRDMEVSFRLQCEIESLYDACVDRYDALIDGAEKEAKESQEVNNNVSEESFKQPEPCTSRKKVRTDELSSKLRTLRLEKQARLAKLHCYKEQSVILNDHLQELMGFEYGRIPDGMQKILENLEKIYVKRRKEVQLQQTNSSPPIRKMQHIDGATNNYQDMSTSQMLVPVRNQPDVRKSVLCQQLNQYTPLRFPSVENEIEVVDGATRRKPRNMSDVIPSADTRNQLFKPTNLKDIIKTTVKMVEENSILPNCGVSLEKFWGALNSLAKFNDAFSAKRLGNWETTVRHPGKFGSKRQGPTEVIADDRGHLLPHISRAGFSSPWGDHKAYVWETVGYGIPPKTDSNPPKARPKIAPKLPKFFKKPTKLPKLPAKRPQGVKPAVDPILNQLRERRLPIIWMVGLPTERIQKLREKFCEELSRALDYAYININDSIERWKLRQGVRFAEPVPCTGNLKENIPPSSSLPTRHKLQSAFQPASICIPAQISPSLLNQVIAYDKTPDRAALAYAYHVNIHRQSRQRQATAVSQVAQQFDPITGEEIQMNSPGNMIQFDLGQPFTRDKLMDLLKFAMVESNPTKGYIIDGVFLEEGDGVCFEKMFYAPAVCTYITESIVNNTIEEWNKLRSSRPPAQDLVIDKQIKTQVKLIPPKARRNKKYSFIEVDKLCRSFETKLIRVLNAEEANEETIHFVYSLVYKHIKNYPNLTDEPKVNFFDPCYSEPEGDVSDAFLSPVNSAITTSRSVVEKVKDPIQEDIQEMINAHLPVIWVLGFRQAGTEEIRKSFCNKLVSQMNFTYLNLDDEIRKWYDYDDINQSDIRSKVMSRIHCMSKVIMDKKESLTSEKTVELIKYAMLLSSESTNGYILDEFPISMAEGSLFEQQLYPCTSLVYFLNFTWTTNKSVEPDVQSPINLHREELYSEEMVEKVCNHHGYKAIKVWNAEDLDEHGMTAISNIIAECISASRNGQVPTTHSQLRSPCFRNLIMPEDEHINNDLLYDNYFPENTTRKPTVQRAQKVSALGSNRLVDLSDIESSQQSNDEDEANSEDNSLENTAHRECSQSDVEEATELIDLDNEEEQALLTEVVDLTENDDDVKNIWSGNEGDGTCLDVPNQQEMQPISTDDTNKKLEPFELDEGGGGDW